jgi:hypothetical protein
MTDTRGLALIAAHGHDHWWHAGMRQITRAMIGKGAAGGGHRVWTRHGPGFPKALVGVGLTSKSPRLYRQVCYRRRRRAPFISAAFDVVS